MNLGLMGGIVGSVVGIFGGVVGTYFSVKNTNSPRERAFMIKTSIVGWVFVFGFVLGLWLIPGFYKLLLVPIYIVGLLAGIVWGNKKQAQIRSEELKRA